MRCVVCSVFCQLILAPVLLFRRRFKSFADVLKGIRQHGFSQGMWDALLGRWKAVCELGPCGPLRSVEPWVHWIPPDLNGFYKWVFDALGMFNEFVWQVVISRRDSGLRSWANWPRSHILVETHVIDAEFRKAWMPFFL